MKIEKVWIVSWYNNGEDPVVTAFNNKDAAQRYYEYEIKNPKHVKVCIDKCEIYTTFAVMTS